MEVLEQRFRTLASELAKEIKKEKENEKLQKTN